MKVLVVCTLMLHQLQIAEPIGRHQWQQQPRDRFQFERPMERVDEILRPLDRSRLKEDNAMLLLDRPTPEQRRQIVTDYQELESPERIHVQTRSSCSCESQYEMIDLGDGHYPRYLPVSRCKPKTCQSKFHSCKALPYMVYVLRSREIITPAKDDEKIPETPLPESLRHKWQLKPITISVACVLA
ncbi:prothoracicotropic hormone-like [Osmia bicornis bicornis]|uniref:prothoracicotropic hormone-like n=1 Tax=Osmia bicornis bicornis TaxID=1437191 RepID=UPI001EAF5DC2|nr:prothoracicotropic hormone-like [Osmia bicornis bicornis]